VLGDAPCRIAICPAVWPLPYRFVEFEPAAAEELCGVEFVGLTPFDVSVLLELPRAGFPPRGEAFGLPCGAAVLDAAALAGVPACP
jgi:hypothetical protein